MLMKQQNKEKSLTTHDWWTLIQVTVALKIYIIDLNRVFSVLFNVFIQFIECYC